MARTCTICPKPYDKKGFCSSHWYANKIYGDPLYPVKHPIGNSKHPLYALYGNMKKRCKNPNPADTAFYKERGITVCDRWLLSFQDFVKDMGPRPENTSIDRINNDKGYSPENCRWATPRQQSLNTRKNTSHPNIYFHKAKQKYYVQYMLDRKVVSKGNFNTLEEAIKVKEMMGV